MPFTFHKTAIPDVVRIVPRILNDDRGFFLETYKKSAFAEAGIDITFVQDNHSRSVKDVIRGLHYQTPPAAQAKLVRAIHGRIWDVAVDIRRDSETFGKGVALELNADNCEMMYIPEGFAHGFAVLSDIAEIEYKVSAEYSPENERGILWNDPALNIDWPVSEPIISEKDRRLPPLTRIMQAT
ncbi:MAG: dTDP-4-dehydrorhamnose 3,5-epimerase [Lentisphaeria bacterium]